jgi:aspartate aminotransferase
MFNCLANRILQLAESETMAMAKRSNELRAKGVDVINLSLGEPDFNPPEQLKSAVKTAVDKNLSHYTPVAGYKELREAICRKLKRDNNIDCSPEQIVVSNGAKHSIANVILSLINPEEEVVLLAPYWVSYLELVKLAEGIPVVVNGELQKGFKVDVEQIRKALSPRTKLLIFNSPANPTGVVYDESEIRKIAEVVAEYPNVYVLSDECYEYFIFGKKHISFASFDFIKERVITVNAISKSFAVPGWRLGYISAPIEIARGCEKLQSQFSSAPCSLAQYAAQIAVELSPDIILPMIQTFHKRRDIMVEALGKIEGIKLVPPDGAFYIFPDVSAYYGKTYRGTPVSGSVQLCNYLLEKAHVALVPGQAFGNDRCIRISLSASQDILLKAVERIRTALLELT